MTASISSMLMEPNRYKTGLFKTNYRTLFRFDILHLGTVVVVLGLLGQAGLHLGGVLKAKVTG
jgi:hypothetical protein